MYVRLAFAVAAHLEPEILIVDEVLAVGDIGFQTKCVRKMNEVAKRGATVLFVSHNLGTIRTFCTSAYWLMDGTLVSEGEVSDVVAEYLTASQSPTEVSRQLFLRPPGAHIWIRDARAFSSDSGHSIFETGDKLIIEVEYCSDHPLKSPRVGLAICSQDGVPILSANSHYQMSRDLDEAQLSGIIKCDLGVVPLLAGRYAVSLWLGDEAGNTHHIDAALWIDVTDRDIWGTGKLPTRYGYCWWPTTFEVTGLAVRPHSNTSCI
jgi:lipopolysaccharide transport system ATP-binding protein